MADNRRTRGVPPLDRPPPPQKKGATPPPLPPPPLGGGGLNPRTPPTRDALEAEEVPPSRVLSLCPATVPLTPSASLNGICNPQ